MKKYKLVKSQTNISNGWNLKSGPWAFNDLFFRFVLFRVARFLGKSFVRWRRQVKKNKNKCVTVSFLLFFFSYKSKMALDYNKKKKLKSDTPHKKNLLQWILKNFHRCKYGWMPHFLHFFLLFKILQNVTLCEINLRRLKNKVVITGNSEALNFLKWMCYYTN